MYSSNKANGFLSICNYLKGNMFQYGHMTRNHVVAYFDKTGPELGIINT